MNRGFDAADEGKRVVTADGAVVGRVVRVRDGDAYVEPRPGLLDAWGSWLAPPLRGEWPLPLRNGTVARVDEEAVHLSADVEGPRRASESTRGATPDSG